MSRTLTGKWYLQKTIWSTFIVMVEVIIISWEDPSYGNGGASGYIKQPAKYVKARRADLITLDIKVG